MSKRACSAAAAAAATSATVSKEVSPTRGPVPIGTNTRQKSRSHLVLFEEVGNQVVPDRIARQTEHHNAIGYLARPQLEPTASTNATGAASSTTVSKSLADRQTPNDTNSGKCMPFGTLNSEIKATTKSQLDIYEQYHAYQRAMSPDKPMLTLADRNQSSAVAQAIGGFGYDTFNESGSFEHNNSTGRRSQSSLGISGLTSSSVTTLTSSIPRQQQQQSSNLFRSHQQRPTFEEDYFDGFHEEGNQYRPQSQSFYETTYNGRPITPPIVGLAAHTSQQYHFERNKKHHQHYHSSSPSPHPPLPQALLSPHNHHHQEKTSGQILCPKADSEESFFSLVDQYEQNQTRSHSSPFHSQRTQHSAYSINRMESQNVSLFRPDFYSQNSHACSARSILIVYNLIFSKHLYFLNIPIMSRCSFHMEEMGRPIINWFHSKMVKFLLHIYRNFNSNKQ